MPFDILETVQSQYAASPHITSLVTNFYDLINPYPDITIFYDNVFNLSTAQGWGLDCWGRIVGIERKISGVPTMRDYFGFDPSPGLNDLITGFDQAAFYNSDELTTGTYFLQDNAYRLLIQTKAAANIGTGSLADLNRQLHSMLPDTPALVLNVGTMKIRIVVEGLLETFERNLLLRGDLPPIPAGVGVELLNYDAMTFGFEGSGLQNFDHGTFVMNGGAVDANL